MQLIIFISIFAAYLFSMAPSITVGDSGEFCASSVILGLPHSPGYPVYCLLGKVFTILFPFADYAYRINLMSAFFAALSLLLIYKIMLLLNAENEDAETIRYPALLAVIFIAFSGAFFNSAIQAEVFSLNTFFALLLIYAYLKNNLYLMSFVFGLGLGNHHTLVFLGILFIFYAVKNRVYTITKYIVPALLFACGFSVYLYLMIRSYSNPGFDWGNPEIFKNLWRVISRADYGSMSLSVGEKLPRNISTITSQIIRSVKGTTDQFTVLGVLIGAWGMFRALKNKYRFSKEAVVLWLITCPGFLLLANMNFDSQSNGILERFFVLVNVFWVFVIFWGLKDFVKNKKFAALFTGLLIAVVIVKADSMSWRNYFLEYDYAKNIFKTCPQNSIFFMDGGDDTFYSTGYLQFARGFRKDIELHDRGGLVFKSVYGPDFRMYDKTAKEKIRNIVENSYFISDRPVLYSTFNKTVLPGVELEPNGFLYAPKKYGLNNSWQFYSLRSVWGVNYKDYRSDALVPIYPYFGAFYHKDAMLDYFKYAQNKWESALWLSSNLKFEIAKQAYDEFSKGKLESAEKFYNTALKMFPNDVSPYINLGVIEEKRNNIEKSRQYYQKAIEIDPEFADAYYNLSVLYWKEGNWQEVVKNLQMILKINPEDTRAKQYLPVAMSKMKINK